jgi:hypothetical protein
MGAHLLGQACRPLSCPRFGPRPVRVSAGWLRLCAECHWLYVSHHNCFTGSVEIRAWIERTQQVFTHVKFLTEFLERALVRKAVGPVLGGPRSLCAPSALATLCEVHDDGLQAARREAPSVPCLKFRRNIEELHRRGKRKAARARPARPFRI